MTHKIIDLKSWKSAASSPAGFPDYFEKTGKQMDVQHPESTGNAWKCL